MKDIKELSRYLSDPVWRLENLYYIKDKYGRRVKLKCNPPQRKLLRDMEHLNAVLKARQLGMSTLISLFCMDAMLFNPDQQAGVVDKTRDDADEKLDKISFAWEHLDAEKNADGTPNPTAGLGAGLKKALPMTTDNEGEKQWANGSGIRAGTSLRGGTMQYLHVSEFGYVAYYFPTRAKEIQEGAFNTVAAGQYVFVESTHEGGRTGLCYDLMRSAIDNQGREITPLEWRFHFFPWWQDKAYTLDPSKVAVRDQIKEYAMELEREHDIRLTPAQVAWYDVKERTFREGMLKEYPSTPEEAFSAVVKGAIYAKYIRDLRTEGRVCNFGLERGAPVYTFWDIGGAGASSDWTSIWLIQPAGRDFLVRANLTCAGEDAQYYANAIRDWEREMGIRIAAHYLPHDARARRQLSKSSNLDLLRAAGLDNLRVVPRTPDLWIGINYVRGLLPRCYFHASGCQTSWELDGDEMPSGLHCLEAYHKHEVDVGGTLREQPVHDYTSHAADGFRTFGEAYERGMIPRTTKSYRGEGDTGPVVVGVSRSPGARRAGRAFVRKP